MAGSWREVTLADVVSLQRGHDLTEAERRPGRVPVYGSAGHNGFHDTVRSKGPGIVIGRSGASFGKVHFSPTDYWPHNTALYVTDFKGNDARFVYYLLNEIDFTAFNSGSAQPSLNRNYIANIKVTLPELDEQERIAAAVGAFDDRITLLRDTNRTLEDMARLLFRGWFVDFEPVRAKMEGRAPTSCDAATAALFPDRLVESELGEVPEGWEVKGLDEIADFLNGLALQKYPPKPGEATYPVIKIAQLRKGDSDDADRCSRSVPSEYVVSDGDFLFSWSGSLMADIWCGGVGALNQHLFKVTSKRYPQWLSFYWTKHHLPGFQDIAASKATTMGHIQRHHLREAKVVVPPEPLIRNLGAQVAALLERQASNRLQARDLAVVRDELLPRLMSGSLQVP